MPPSRMAPKDSSPRTAVSSSASAPLGSSRADRLGEAESALDHDIRAVAAYQLGICWLGVGDNLYSPAVSRPRSRIEPEAQRHRSRLRSDPSSAQQFPAR